MVSDIDWGNEPVPDLSRYDTYEEARGGFEWRIPEEFNAGVDVVTRHADDRGRVALFHETEDGEVSQYTYWQLERRSNRIANALRDRGIERGDRVAVVSSQRIETPLVHVAAYKLGAVAVPLSVLYGPDALEYRLDDSGTRAVFAEPDAFDGVREAVDRVDSVERIVGIDRDPPAPDGIEGERFADLDGERRFDPVDTSRDDPAVLLYTSGTTGAPKGVLQRHEYLLGHLPCVQMALEVPWQDADPVFYTPADWAWAGGLYDVLLPAWHYGFPAVGYHATEFDPEVTYRLIDEYGITSLLLTPTMLKMLSDADPEPYDLSSVAAICTGGEPVARELHRFVDETFGGAPLLELYGQTEANLVVANCSRWFEPVPGSMGRPVPGHEVEIIDENGDPEPAGEDGIIGVKSPDPSMFTEYWNAPDRTEESFIGDWLDTGDLGRRDEDGRLWFRARADDVIITSGYRVSPAEVEDALLEHEAVLNAGVIGVDDETRGKIVKAYVVPREGYEPSADIAEDVQGFVRENLAKYQYPREVEFVDELPKTTTGKIQRYQLRERERG